MGGRESKLNAKACDHDGLSRPAKRGMVEIDEYGEDKLARRRQQLENWRNQEELRMKSTTRWPAPSSKVRSTATSTTAPTCQFDNGPKDEVSSEQVTGMTKGDLTTPWPSPLAERARRRRIRSGTSSRRTPTSRPGLWFFVRGHGRTHTWHEPTCRDPPGVRHQFQPTDYADSYDATLVIDG